MPPHVKRHLGTGDKIQPVVGIQKGQAGVGFQGAVTHGRRFVVPLDYQVGCPESGLNIAKFVLTVRRDIVLDPFLGSGTTLVAA